MKSALFSICLVLSFFAVGVVVAEPGTFGMKNSNGDSAYCKMTSFKKTAEEIDKNFKDGEILRRSFFEEEGFKKIIENTELKKKFDVVGTKYEKMKDCQLIYKSSLKSEDDTEASATIAFSTASDDQESASPPPRDKPRRGQATSAPAVDSEGVSLDTAGKAVSTLPFPKFYIAIIVLVLIVIVIFMITRKRNTGEDDALTGFTLGSREGDAVGHRHRKDTVNTVTDGEEREIDSLKNDVQLLKNEIARLKKEQGAVNTAEQPIAQEIHAAAPAAIAVPIDTFFFAGPIENTFSASRKTDEFVDGKSLYQFDQVRGSNRAKFVVVDGYESVVQRFVYSPELQAGVCDVIGNYNQDASQIQTEDPGEAVLNGDTWTVEKKAKIRYR